MFEFEEEKLLGFSREPVECKQGLMYLCTIKSELEFEMQIPDLNLYNGR